MNDGRPNPDQLLRAIGSTEGTQGALKIFFGYAAGVGKSYAMLKAAHELKKQGIDVVVGYLEPHGRPETEGLLEGLEILPVKSIAYGNITLKEFDLDAALKRKPQVILVDELAHTNATGCRHTKRWQDIDELLAAGISVHSTVNVQHLASLGDIVAQITGVLVRETVPDAIFDKAQEITLVDITPDELLGRLKSGKVYRTGQAERALGNYFKKSNLVALREIALRRTAERVHADVAVARTTGNIQGLWATSERLLCVVGADRGSANAIRATARLAGILQAPWEAIVVAAPRLMWQSLSDEKIMRENIALAESMGGKLIYRSATFATAEAIAYANESSATKIIVSRPTGFSPSPWIEKLWFIFAAPALDIIWIHPLARQTPLTQHPFPRATVDSFNWKAYLSATGYVFVAFVLAATIDILFNAPEANVTLLYLLAVIVAAVIHGQGASAWAATLAAFFLSFGLTNFSWRLSWYNTQYLLSFGLTLGMGLMAATATSRLKHQAELARLARRNAEDLYEFSAALTEASGLHQIVSAAEERLAKLMGRDFIVFLNSPEGYRPLSQGTSPVYTSADESAVANYVATHGQPAGVGTQTLPQASARYQPLEGSDGVVGVLAIVGAEPLTLPEKTLLEKFTHALAIKLEAALISEDAQKLYWQAERERLRGDLLSSVSVGLKMPLVVLAATATSLSEGRSSLAPKEQDELLDLIHDESIRLSRVVDNLTNLTRFESGKLPLNRQLVEINEFVRTELDSLARITARNPVTFHPYAASIRAAFDPLMISQVLFNIIDNAVQHTPAGTPIIISIQPIESFVEITIADGGEGLPEAELENVFEKYYRLSTHTRGAGLGLTVCRAVIEAHGGKIWAENLSPQGLKLSIQLPQLAE